jgi:MoxR-like ATPase
LKPVVPAEELVEAQGRVREVRVEGSLREYLVQVVQATRDHPALDLGASPRASLALYRAAQALAALRGRDYVLPDDIKYLALPALGHRLLLSSQSRLRRQTGEAVLEEVLAGVPVPLVDRV